MKLQSLLGTLNVLLVSMVLSPKLQAHYPHDVIADVQVSPGYLVDQRVFVTARGLLYRSDTGGYHWQLLSRGLTCDAGLTSISVSPTFVQDGVVAVACRSGGVFVSRDHGDSWTFRVLPQAAGTVQGLAHSDAASEDAQLLAFDEQGLLWQSDKLGLAWRRMTSLNSVVTQLIATRSGLAVGTARGALLASEDGGESWQPLALQPLGSPITSVVQPSTDHPGTWWVGTQELGVQALDVTGGWRDAGLSGEHVTGLAMATLDGRDVLLATTWREAIYRSQDFGVSWQLEDDTVFSIDQADQYEVPYFSRLVYLPDGSVIAGGFCGLFHSRDAGKRWQPMAVSLHHITGVAVSEAREEGYDIAVATYGGGALMSSDAGERWQFHGEGLPTARLSPIVFSPDYPAPWSLLTSSFNVIAGSGDEFTRWEQGSLIRPYSIDWFIGWLNRRARGNAMAEDTLRSLGLYFRHPFVFPVNLVVSPTYAQDKTVYSVNYPGGLYRSFDGGRSFEALQDMRTEPIVSLVAVPHSPGDHVLLASDRLGLLRSVDKGESWARLSPATGFNSSLLDVGMRADGSSRVFALDAKGIYASDNLGSDWVLLAPASPETGGGRLLAVSPDYGNDDTVFVQYPGEALQRCVVFGVNASQSMKCVDTQLTGDLGHMVTRDRGRLMAFSPNYAVDGIVFAATGFVLQKSTDRGVSWRVMEMPRRFEAESSEARHIFLPLRVVGDWGVERAGDLSSKAALRSDVPGSELTLRFFGSGVRWLGVDGPDGGTAQLFIDGAKRTVVDQHGPERLPGTVSFEVALPRGVHELTIRLPEQSAGAGVVRIDALDIMP